MSKKSGRHTIVSDFRPRDLFNIFFEVAGECGFGLSEHDGPMTAVAEKQFIKRQNFHDTVVAHMAIEVVADTTKRGDGRLTLDWEEKKAIWIWGGGGKAEKWLAELIETLEDAIEDDGGEVIRSEAED